MKKIRTERKYKVEGGVKKQRWFRLLRKDHIDNMRFLNKYKNNEND